MITNINDEISKLETEEFPLTENEKMRIMSKIRRELPREKKHGKLIVLTKTLTTAAAAFALLIGVGYVNPVFAENVPFINSIVSMLKGGEMGYSSPVVMEGAVDEHLTALAVTDEKPFTINETYCDGKALVLGVTYKLDSTAVDPDADKLLPTYKYTINGQEYSITHEYSGETQTEFADYTNQAARLDENTFIGVITLDVSEFNLTEDFDLSLAPVSLMASNSCYFVADAESGSYSAKTYEVNAKIDPADVKIKLDTTLQKLYSVNETKDIVTLNSISTSPAFTKIDWTTTEDDSADPIIMFVYDNNGNEVQWLKFGNDDRFNNPLLKDTTSVTAKFFRKSNRKTPVAEFTVPVECGYADPRTELFRNNDNKEIIYDPPITETPVNTLNRNPEGAVYKLGDTITSDYSLENGTMDITYSNMQVFGSYEEAGVKLEDLSFDNRNVSANTKFVTFDVKFATHDADTKPSDKLDYSVDQGRGIYDAEARNYEKFDDTTRTYWISTYCRLQKVTIDNYDGFLSNGEIPYFSGAMGGITNYYHFVMNANDERTFTVGVFVEDEYLKSGNLQITLESDSYPSSNSQYGLVGPADCCDYIEIPAWNQ